MGCRQPVDQLSTSGVSSSQAAASTMDADDNEDEDDEGEDMDRAVESGDDEDGERVDIVLAGTGVDLGESAVEEEMEGEEEKDEEDEAEGSRPTHMAEAEAFTPPAPQCVPGKERG